MDEFVWKILVRSDTEHVLCTNMTHYLHEFKLGELEEEISEMISRRVDIISDFDESVVDRLDGHINSTLSKILEHRVCIQWTKRFDQFLQDAVINKFELVHVGHGGQDIFKEYDDRSLYSDKYTSVFWKELFPKKKKCRFFQKKKTYFKYDAPKPKKTRYLYQHST